MLSGKGRWGWEGGWEGSVKRGQLITPAKRVNKVRLHNVHLEMFSVCARPCGTYSGYGPFPRLIFGNTTIFILGY